MIPCIATRVRSSLATAAFLLPAMISGACTSGDPGAMEEYAPDSHEASIASVSLGTNDTDEWDVSQAGTDFPNGTDRVVVWYRWEGAEPSLRIDNRWSKQGEVILDQGERVGDVAGSAAWFLKSASGGALPAGKYQVELIEDGAVVTTIPFTVGQE